MKKALIPFAALAVFATVATTSCGKTEEWSYESGLGDGELGYVTLFGEKDNVEAKDRRDGVKAALEAVVGELVNPKTGKKDIKLKDYGELLCVKNGQGWNGEAAKEQLQPVLTKHKGKIDLISSNNDGMAVAVTALNNLPKYTPIVGFDALTDACEMIEKGTLAGSVTQNGDDQALLALTILNNVILGKETLTEGYTKDNLEAGLADKHIYQTKISAVTKENADKYKPGAYDPSIKEVTGIKGKKLLVVTYSSVDNFINETYKAALTHYGKAMGYEVTLIAGDGSKDQNLRDQIAAATGKTAFDAFAFNMIEHTAYKDYLKLAGDKPVVFFNRQPRSGDTTINDLSSLHNGKAFFVGTAAGGQGTTQGQVVTTFFKGLSDKVKVAE